MSHRDQVLPPPPGMTGILTNAGQAHHHWAILCSLLQFCVCLCVNLCTTVQTGAFPLLPPCVFQRSGLGYHIGDKLSLYPLALRFTLFFDSQLWPNILRFANSYAFVFPTAYYSPFFIFAEIQASFSWCLCKSSLLRLENDPVVFPAFPEDWCSVPSTHVERLTTICNSR